jgi:hypothetical protein
VRWLCLVGLVACSHAASTELALRITADGTPVAARVQLVANGAMLHIGAIDLYGARQGGTACGFADDAIGTWNGIIVGNGVAAIPVGKDRCSPTPAIPYGRYHVIAWHGIDYQRWEGDVDLSAGRGRVELAIALERAWSAPGTLAADLHVHAHGSNDSGMPDVQRALAQLAAGIQVTAISNHNAPGTLADAIRALHAEARIAALPSIELTADPLHVGVYPVPLTDVKDVDAIVHADATKLFAIAHAYPDAIIQLNHPRFRVTALYDTAHWDGTSWPPPFPRGFDAVEVLNGFTAFNATGDRRIDDSVRDFYTLVDHGWLVAPVGNSDSHDFNWVHDGLARTFVYVPDARTQPFDQAAFVAAIRARRTVATTGPWLDVKIGSAGPGQIANADHGEVTLTIDVAQANFVHADRVRVTLGTASGPTVVETIPIGGATLHWQKAIAVGATDTWIGVTADGDTPMPLEQTGSYQKDKWKRAGNTPFAIASPILVDADGDGRWKRGDADLQR